MSLLVPTVRAQEATAGEPMSDAELQALLAESGESGEVAAEELRLEDLALEEIQILGVRHNAVGGSLHRVDGETLARAGYADPHDVVALAPGVYVRGEDGFGLRPNIGMRGVSSERSRKITLMEDGVLFGPAPYSSPAAYYFPMLSRMDGFDVWKGPGALRFGPQTIGGTLNFHSRAFPTGTRGSLAARFGSFYTHAFELNVGTASDHAGILLEAAEMGSQGFKHIDVNGADESPSTGFERGEYLLRAFVQTSSRRSVFHRVELRFGFSHERSNETYIGLTDADFALDPYRRYASSALDRMQWWRTSGVVTWHAEHGDDWEVVTDLYRHDFDRSWLRFQGFTDSRLEPFQVVSSPTGVRADAAALLRGERDSAGDMDTMSLTDNARRFVSQGIQSRFRYWHTQGNFRHTLEAGLRLHHDQIERNHRYYEYAMHAGRLNFTGNERLAVANEGQAVALAAHVVYELSAFGVTISPGIRAEFIDTSLSDRDIGLVDDPVQVAILPGVGAAYALRQDLSVFAGVHRGFSPVAPGQDAGVLPEFSVNYELGLRYTDSSKHRNAEVAGFVSDYSNLTSQCGFSSGCTEDRGDRQFNAGQVLVYGVEAAFGWTFRVGQASIPVRGSYAFTQSSFQTAFMSQDPTLGSVEVGDELPYVPSHQAHAEAGVDFPRFGGNLAVTLVSAMREQAGQSEEETHTDGYGKLDAQLWAGNQEGVSVFVRGENLTNAAPIVSRRPFGARPIAPLTIQAGVRAQF